MDTPTNFASPAPAPERKPDPFHPFDAEPIDSARFAHGLSHSSGFFRDALGYQPDDALREVLWAGWVLQRPVLLRGTPGSGKSTAAYWAALKLLAATSPKGAEESDETARFLHHVQIRSTTTAQELKYEFDHLLRLRDANLRDGKSHAAERYVRPRPLWYAFDRHSPRAGYVVLLDEFDKAPRDLPNDLLYELDKFEFELPELSTERETQVRIGVNPVFGIAGYATRREPWVQKQNLYVVTSNDERTLPPAFLRRCLHHRIELDEPRIAKILAARFGAWANNVSFISRLSDFLSRRKFDPREVMSFTNRIAWLTLAAGKGGHVVVEALATNGRPGQAAPTPKPEEKKELTLAEVVATPQLGVLLDSTLLANLRAEHEKQARMSAVAPPG